MITSTHNVVEFTRRHEKPVDRLRMPAAFPAHQVVPVAMLNEVLTTELVGVLRYRRYSLATKHPLVDRVKGSFLKYAREQQEQADHIAERIVQLGGAPQLDPSELAARTEVRCAAGTDLQDMVAEDLLFVRTAIETYADMLRYFEPGDGTTARLLKQILAVHEQHAQALGALFTGLTPSLKVPV